ncbi:peptidase S8 [Fictibacillus phosphorivorans]|uniref:Peptidase S8 n=1 Tax=Fictibacillus phosphorivorans TaxID=1221500 RepID=A0A161RWN6_9BACL|nr:S8 family serine peptidase [Fictibacillus phosphorivorans]KZE69076.1 peptidase S8 [Fictibacillus phosphorivorans]
MKMRGIVLAFLLTFGTLFNTIVPFQKVNALTSSAVVDEQLVKRFTNSITPQQVIVTFKKEVLEKEQKLELLKEAGITKGILLKELPIAGAVATKAQVDELANNENVLSIYYNKPLKYENKEATELTGVDRLRTEESFRKANGGLPVSGKGVGVVINDSGVDGTHKDIEYGSHLVQNVLGATNLQAQNELLPITYIENVPNTDTSSGHGTHVAGIVGGTGAMSGGEYEGVAPGADLIGYGSGAAVAMLDTLGGFDYALTHQAEYNIRVITNSWGDTSDSGTDFDPNNPINVATKELYDRGIVTVFSAGNSGPTDSTISGNYKKAPWVITVAAGTKQGKLANFSSRGVKNKGGTVTVDGETWKWVDEPTVTSPGESIVSTRVIAPVAGLGAPDDVALIPPAYIPYYTTMSGTSMAAPHVAGIVALLLDANPSLSPLEVKEILQQTATNMPGYENWEVGAGYVNAYSAVDAAFNNSAYGKTLNVNRSFNASASLTESKQSFTFDYSPPSTYQKTFTVGSGQTELVARFHAKGLLEQTGNTLNLALISPDGTRYSSGISALFPLYTDRAVQVVNPIPGTWTVAVEGLQKVIALPETVQGEIVLKKSSSYTGLNDIAGHPAESAIQLAVNERLVDSKNTKNFEPDQPLKRAELADFLVMGAGVRQYLPLNGLKTVSDVKADDLPFVEAVLAKGAALKDVGQTTNGVMLPTANETFSPDGKVDRLQLAYSMVQALGLEKEAKARSGEAITVQYGNLRVPVKDEGLIPGHLRGYVQVALDLNILNAYFSVSQGPYDLTPQIEAKFDPSKTITRADYAVIITRYYANYHK